MIGNAESPVSAERGEVFDDAYPKNAPRRIWYDLFEGGIEQ